MANVVITFKIMPESPDTDLAVVEKKVKEAIVRFGGYVGSATIEPVAFGLKAIKIIFSSDEQKGSTDTLEEEIVSFAGVESCTVVDVRRAFG